MLYAIGITKRVKNSPYGSSFTIEAGLYLINR
jgi:hypothetical protein